METIPCNLCEKDQAEHLFTVDSFQICRCTNCGLVYVNPRLTQPELQVIYNSQEYYEGSYPDYLHKKQFIDWESRRQLKILDRLCVGEGRKTLDIGCSFGFFLDSARQIGWRAYGIELSRKSSQFARQELNLDVTTGSIEDADFSSEFFDAVTMWDVIEHVPDPTATLIKVKQFMKPGGVLALATPNLTSPLAKFTKANWDQIKPQYHLYYFSPAALDALLRKVGFIPIKISTIGFGGLIRLLTGKVGSDSDSLAANTSKTKYYIKSILNKLAEWSHSGERLYVYARKRK